MAGETRLSKLLASLAPRLLEDEYVFCSLEGASYGDFKELNPLATFREKEGLTLVLPRQRADEQALGYVSVFKAITLTVHSSLNAVGLTAAVSAKLAEQGISANVIAAYYHDHIFVPAASAERALAALDELSSRADP